MKIVVDSNRAIAALIKDSTTREILYNKEFEFFAPEYIKSDIGRYKNEIIQKAEITNDEFEVLLPLIFEHIIIISKNEYQEFIGELQNEISDPDDVAYLAVCLFIHAEGIWTHDPHFNEQKKVRVFTNIDMLSFIDRSE